MKGMFSSETVAQRLSQGLDEPLGLIDRTRFRIHQSMCNNCRNVAQQLEDVRALSAELFRADTSLDDDVDAAIDRPSGARPRQSRRNA